MSCMSFIDESNLIQKCKTGNSDSFLPLIKPYKQKLFYYLFKLCNSKIMAEDVFQETLIKTWKGIRKYNEQQKFSSWLFTIAHNTAMDELRKMKKENNYLDVEPDELSSESNPYSELIKNEEKEMINKAISILSEKQKEVFLLRVYGEMSFKEIAELTKEPINTVLSHMHYSIKKMQNVLRYENA